MRYSERFENAFLYANRLHANQSRKGAGVPYIAHLMLVAGIVADYGGYEDQVIAALLHDAVEDQGGRPRLNEIREQFGDRIAGIVEDCSDSFTEPKPPWRDRKNAYLARLQHVSPESLLVSAADKLHNARMTLEDVRHEGRAAFEKFKGKREGTLWYFRSLVEAYASRGRTALVDELDRTVQLLHRLDAGCKD